MNCVPVPLATDPVWAKRFEDAGLPLIGDDIKSQYGATIVHRALTQLVTDRGLRLLNTYQLNVGGNADFRNMADSERLVDKRRSKSEAVTDTVEISEEKLHIGPSDFVPHLGDQKVAFIQLRAEGWNRAPIRVDLRLEVADSPNSAGVVAETIRAAKLAIDREEVGVIDDVCGWLMKCPRKKVSEDSQARDRYRSWLDRGAR